MAFCGSLICNGEEPATDEETAFHFLMKSTLLQCFGNDSIDEKENEVNSLNS